MSLRSYFGPGDLLISLPWRVHSIYIFQLFQLSLVSSAYREDNGTGGAVGLQPVERAHISCILRSKSLTAVAPLCNVIPSILLSLVRETLIITFPQTYFHPID